MAHINFRVPSKNSFPNCSILEAQLGSHPWRAILEGRDVLAQGIINRNEDGRSTKISKDNWLDSRAGSSNMENKKVGWSTIWKLKVPSKLKFFVWRLAQNSLPSKDILMR